MFNTIIFPSGGYIDLAKEPDYVAGMRKCMREGDVSGFEESVRGYQQYQGQKPYLSTEEIEELRKGTYAKRAGQRLWGLGIYFREDCWDVLSDYNALMGEIGIVKRDATRGGIDVSRRANGLERRIKQELNRRYLWDPINLRWHKR